MATGDPSGVQALAGGEQIQITFEGLTHSSIVQNSDITASITGVHGFDDTGTHQTNKTRIGIRLKFISATDSSGDAVCVFACEEPIYPDGTISLNASSGAISDGSNDSTAFSGQSCTNNSTLAYDKPTCNFISKVWERVVSEIDIEVDAAAGAFRGHRSNRGVACVQITVNEPIEVTGVTGTFSAGETVTGGTSGATAEFIAVSSGVMYVRKMSGTWSAAETITGGTSSATATYSSAGRAVTKTITDITRVDAYGSLGWQDTMPAHAETFDFSDGSGDWSGGITNKRRVFVDAVAFPAIGGSSAFRHSWPMVQFANPDDDLDVQENHCDPSGTMTLSVGLSDDLAIGTQIVGGTSGARAVVNQAYSSGATSISVSQITNTTWNTSESFTADGGVTGTISGITWNGDDSTGDGSLGNPYRMTIKAVKECENDSSDNVASYSTVKVKAGRAVIGPYVLANRANTSLGPVNITRADGVAEADAVICGSADNTDVDSTDGLRTHIFRLHDIKVDFKYYETPSGVTNEGLYHITGGSAATDALVGSGRGFIMDNVKVEGRGRLLGGASDVYWHEQTFAKLGIYLYGCEFIELNDACAKATISRDCYVHDCSGDWHRPFDSELAGDTLTLVDTDNLGNIAINNRLSLDSSGTGTHCDDWQFVGSGTTDYENVAFVQNRSYDRSDAQQGPFYNGGNTAMDDSVSRATSVHMSLNVTESDGTVQISQLDDCFLRGWYCYHNSFGDTILLRNNYKQRNAFWSRNYFSELAESSTGLLPNTGYVDNHNADLFAYTAVDAEGFDNTSGGSVGTLFDDFDTTYLPKSGGDLLDRGYDDPLIPTDAAGTEFPTDGSGAVGALQPEGTPTIQVTLDPNGTPEVVASGETLDYGTVANSQVISRAIEIENTGDAMLTLDLDSGTTFSDGTNFAKGSGDWSDGVELEPAETLQLGITFNQAMTALDADTYTDELSIGSDDADSPFLLNLSATIAAAQTVLSRRLTGGPAISFRVRIK